MRSTWSGYVAASIGLFYPSGNARNQGRSVAVQFLDTTGFWRDFLSIGISVGPSPMDDYPCHHDVAPLPDPPLLLNGHFTMSVVRE
jgi:hypothetical protein